MRFARLRARAQGDGVLHVILIAAAAASLLAPLGIVVRAGPALMRLRPHMTNRGQAPGRAAPATIAGTPGQGRAPLHPWRRKCGHDTGKVLIYDLDCKLLNKIALVGMMIDGGS
jgi:hypothetical protein